VPRRRVAGSHEQPATRASANGPAYRGTITYAHEGKAIVSDAQSRRRTRRGRRWLALSAAATLGATTLLAAQPSAAAGVDSWVSVPANVYPNVYRFTVPASAATAAAGTAPALVAVEGNFGPGKTWAQLNMASSAGNWTGTIGPLEPGLYYYHYEATIAGSEALVGFRNPASPQEVTSQPTWNTFFVPGPGAEWLADVPDGGQLQTIDYTSTVSGSTRSVLVWTPPGFDAARAQPYPVLYLLQDEGQSYREWVELGRLPQILDNLTVDGDIEPMVVVMGDGDSSDARAEVLDNIVAAAQAAFNISSDPADRAIAGIGRGASQALNLLLTDPGTFTKVGSFSGRLGSAVTPAQAAQINATTDLIRLYVGNVTDPAYNSTVSIADAFTNAGVQFQSDGSDPATGGTWDTWQKSLHDFASRVFTASANPAQSEGHLPLTPHSLPAPGTTPTPWIDENNIVTFETGTEYADATNITVWSNWGHEGNWLRVPMVKQPDGRWRLTIGPLLGGSYYYKFIVDRVDRKDTSNPTSTLSEPNWSFFSVPGTGVRAEFTGDVAPESRGTVTVLNFTSSAAGNPTRQANVYTPAGYDPNRATPYPVLFLQHGGGQTWTDWVDVGRAAQILDNHYLRGDIEPMVVVMHNGNGINLNTELNQRLIPAVMANFNVSSQPGERAIAGLSAGSIAALGLTFANPGQFAYVGSFSGGTSIPANANVTDINAGTRLLWVSTGDIQDFAYQGTVNMINTMDARGINHAELVVYPGPHSWDVWQKSLIDFLPLIFTNHRPVFAAGGQSWSIDENTPLTFSVEATDPDGDELTYSASDLPAGASFDPATRTFFWRPGYTQAGEYPVTFTAVDGAKWYSLSGTKQVTITVRDIPAWSPTTTYDAGDQISHNGSTWVASWWTRNQVPGDPYGPWQEIQIADDGTAIWTPSRIFVAGDVVVHSGQRYEAKWWTRNQAPGDPYGPWQPVD
jgi:enterochelin esterase-like enzyme